VDSKKVFLDTNIVLDILDNSRTDSDSIKAFLKKLIVDRYTVVISEDMLSTIFYIQKDKRKTLEFFKVIYKRWIISSFGEDVMKNAIDLSFEYSLDLEDILQCLCAKENGCDVLITNDKNFYDCGMKIMTIEEFK
jgi:predicted nucleic acid-binding protein